jgi:hypothetical protein
MKFKKLKVKIFSDDILYGYEHNFKDGLNIIRGDNSSGKSTLVNSLIYSLGMEEIIGSKGPNTLPYALKTYFELDDKKIPILESVVLVEVENNLGEIKTFKRHITSPNKNSKLVEVIHGDYLTQQEKKPFKSNFTFLHDADSAKDVELGFFAYFEKFIGLNLPIVSNNKGKDTKLYLQTIFSSLLIEQKRGWTNYIANTPYYPITSLREKIVSYLLDLDKFRNEKSLDGFTSERNEITAKWSEITTSIKLLLNANSLTASGLMSKPTIDFRPELISFGEGNAEEFRSVATIISDLADKLRGGDTKEKASLNISSPDIVQKIENTRNRISELLLVHKMCGDEVRINKAKQLQYHLTLSSVLDDLKKNKLTKKVNEFGADFELKVAIGECGTCLNPIDNTLAPPANLSMPMSIDENIKYLDNQKTMIESLINGLEKNIQREQASLTKVARKLTDKKEELLSYKKDIKSLSAITESDIRLKIHLENRYKNLSEVVEHIEELLLKQKVLSLEYQVCISEISKLNRYEISWNDKTKIDAFEESFRELANNFDYRSAQVSEININPSSLIPYLQGLELREYKSDKVSLKAQSVPSTDIKDDSSASDFVRLIWAYLISIYKVSKLHKGNHPGVILFDEPAQHSMGLHSVNEMLKVLSEINGLQSIVAASFEQSDAAFIESTEGVNFHLIKLPSKLINVLDM